MSGKRKRALKWWEIENNRQEAIRTKTKKRRGMRVKTVEALAAELPRCVVVDGWSRPCPVTFILNMQAREVLRILQRGVWKYSEVK